MDDDLAFAILALIAVPLAAIAMGWLPARAGRATSAVERERRAWLRLWTPLFPAAIVFAALSGWAWAEPSETEPVPRSLIAVAGLLAILIIRCAARALKSMRAGARQPLAAAVGLVAPAVVVAPCLRAELDESALAAAIAHERAHARHRDPLRIWLAQLGADLQWPWPAASRRLRVWRDTLEMARDEQAIGGGIDGIDLAHAILTAARLEGDFGPSPMAALGDRSAALRERIARLLDSDGSPHLRRPTRSLALPIAIVMAAAASVLGGAYGEPVIRALLAAIS